jgi:hypothetical protein
VVADFARFGAFAFATGWKPFDEKGHTVLDANFRRAFEWYTGLVKRGAARFAQDLGEGWTGRLLRRGEGGHGPGGRLDRWVPAGQGPQHAL